MFITKKKYALMLLIFFISICPVGAGLGATPVILPGVWWLEDMYEIRYGQDYFKTYTYDEIQSLYNENHPDKKDAEINLESNHIQYRQCELQLQSINDSIQKYRQWVQENEDLANLYEQELAGAILQKAELYMQKENCRFIHDNAVTYRNQQRITQLSLFRNTIFEIKFIKENYQAQGSFAEYAKLQAAIQTISQINERILQTEADFYNADYDYFLGRQEMLNRQFENNLELLLSHSNLATLSGIVITADTKSIKSKSFINYESLEKDSYTNDIKKKQLENEVSLLQEKINILKEYYAEDSSQVQLTKKEKELAEVALKKWLIQRKYLLKDAYIGYKNKYYEIGVNERKAKAQYEKYMMLLNKHNFGLTDSKTVKEAEVNYLQSRLVVWQALYEYSKALGRIEVCMSGKIE